MSPDDRIRIQHMRDAAAEAIAATQGRTQEDLAKDNVWALGLVKCMEIIGEAAARIGRKTQTQYPQIPWIEITTMRNRLVHVYFDIDLDQVWKGITEDLPVLVSKLEMILEETRGE
jgi:uncharacterized protein with HEPN domain